VTAVVIIGGWGLKLRVAVVPSDEPDGPPNWQKAGDTKTAKKAAARNKVAEKPMFKPPFMSICPIPAAPGGTCSLSPSDRSNASLLERDDLSSIPALKAA
jgi:hypothetical protein